MDLDDYEEEDWLFTTMNRYKHLLIYDLLSTPYKIKAISVDSAVMATKSIRGRHELLLVSLPEKLLKLDIDEAARCKNRDFGMFGGVHLDGEVADLVVSSHTPDLQLFVSTTEPGIALYKAGTDGSVTLKSKLLESSHISSMDVVGPNLISAGDSCVKLLNYETGSVKEFQQMTDIPKVKFMSENNVLACSKNSGCLSLFDLRTGESECLVPDSEVSTYDFDHNGDIIVRVNQLGNIDVFDRRQLKPVTSFKEEVQEFVPTVACGKNKFLVAGIGGNIPIYSQGKKIFEHEGHARNSERENVKTSDVCWYGYRGDLVFS